MNLWNNNNPQENTRTIEALLEQLKNAINEKKFTKIQDIQKMKNMSQ